MGERTEEYDPDTTIQSNHAVLRGNLESWHRINQRSRMQKDSRHWGQWKQQTVRSGFDEVSAGMHSSWSDKYLARLGDSAAPEIMSYLASKQLTNKDVETALSLVEMSFSNPRLIRRSPSRTPTNTVLLLDYLDKHTSDADTRSRITSTREQLRGQPLGTEPRPNN